MIRSQELAAWLGLGMVAGCAGAQAEPAHVVEPAQRAPVQDAAAARGPLGDAASEVDDAATDASDVREGGEPSKPVPPVSACNEQAPQDFLVRENFLPKGDAEEQKRRRANHEQSVRYRTEQYGKFPGFGKAEWNPHPPVHYVRDTKFFGLPVRMHERVIPALACVEEELKRSCASTPYKPRALGGIRMKNTYHTGEITNHAYGIAIDIDPDLNSCCGCVKPWNENPICRRPSKTEYDRMAMPECWVHVFERFGFYWLGHDVLKDTMHFEFLGDPNKIARPKTPTE